MSTKVTDLAAFKAARTDIPFVKAVRTLCIAAGDLETEARFYAEADVYRLWSDAQDRLIALAKTHVDLLEKYAALLKKQSNQ